MRLEVTELVRQGSLPSSGSDVEKIGLWERALHKIKAPITNEEASVLIGLFPAEDDSCYGLAWTLIHLVETAPTLSSTCEREPNPWVVRLNRRAKQQSTPENWCDPPKETPGGEPYYTAALIGTSLMCDQCSAFLDPDDDLGPNHTFKSDGYFVLLGDEAYGSSSL